MISLLIAFDSTRLSQKTDAYFFASGGEAEPSPPWHARDAPSLSHCHPASVWSRLARQTFRLTPLSSPARRASRGIPPVLEFPPCPGGQHLASVSGKTTSPKPIDGWGGPDHPAALRAADGMCVLAIKYMSRK